MENAILSFHDAVISGVMEAIGYGAIAMEVFFAVVAVTAVIHVVLGRN